MQTTLNMDCIAPPLSSEVTESKDAAGGQQDMLLASGPTAAPRGDATTSPVAVSIGSSFARDRMGIQVSQVVGGRLGTFVEAEGGIGCLYSGGRGRGLVGWMSSSED